jgi:N-acetyl-gamma-glutamyl-phosphate reductase
VPSRKHGASESIPPTPTHAPRVAVLGASGYAGALAAWLLHKHPRFELTALTSRSDVGRRLDDLYPRYRVPMVMEELALERHADGLDAAVVAYPHHAAASTVAGLRERGVKVVDLSADFRLRELSTYERWYGAHPAPALLDGAVYGLPELGYRDAIANAALVANPGCFPTAALLGLAPLARAGLLADVVIDAKTGVSGSGRAATEETHFVTVDENVVAYKVSGHRHAPEIDQELVALGAEGLGPVVFVPHLVPVDQGELISSYVKPTHDVAQAELEELFAAAYADEPFVELSERPPGMHDVENTNVCRISVHGDRHDGRVVVLSAIDNLWKGTSSQAVQNLNLMFGFPEDEGIAT